MPEERKLVTVLFADITGSTAIADTHDAEVVRAALDDAFGRIANVVRDHGGTVEKFIGDAVMAVFGVPRAHDDDAERAVRAAFSIRSIVGSRQEPLPLEVRIGVNTGEVVTHGLGGDQRLATGLAVNIAQRLEAAAAPGEILVGGLTRRLTEAAIMYGPSREVAAKGAGSALAWLAKAPLPGDTRSLAAGAGQAPIVGRDTELRRCEEAFATAVSTRRPYLLSVLGAPGIGKSRLALHFLSGVDASMVLRGRCVPYGEAPTYPVQQMLRADAGVDPHDTQDQAAAKLRRRTADIVGSDEDLDAVQRRVLVLAGAGSAAETLPGVAEHDVPDELRWAFRRYVERRAATAGMILLFEDIHWASPVMLDLIAHLADWARAPLLVLCLARPELLETAPSWGTGRGNGEILELQALSRDETARLIGALLPTTP